MVNSVYCVSQRSKKDLQIKEYLNISWKLIYFIPKFLRAKLCWWENGRILFWQSTQKTIRLYFCIVRDLRLVHNQHSTSDETVQTSRPYIPLQVEAKTVWWSSVEVELYSPSWSSRVACCFFSLAHIHLTVLLWSIINNIWYKKILQAGTVVQDKIDWVTRRLEVG